MTRLHHPASAKAARWPARTVWTGAAAALLLTAAILAVIWPDTRHRMTAWVRYHALGQVPPPLIAGLHGRLFLGNHAGSPPGSLLTETCDTDPAAVSAAATLLRPLLAAARATGIPTRLLIVPTAPRLYPEDLPPPFTCPAPGADALVARLADPAVLYPLGAMTAMKPHFEAVPRVFFHWAGEAPLRVAEWVAADLGLPRTLELPLHDDNRRSDLDGFDRGMALHSTLREPSLAAAGIVTCEGGRRCPTAPLPALVTYVRPGPGRILVMGDSFGDAIGGDFTEFAGTVWLLRMNFALNDPPAALARVAIRAFRPDCIIVVYHDAGALALDAASRLTLAHATAILAAGQP